MGVLLAVEMADETLGGDEATAKTNACGVGLGLGRKGAQRLQSFSAGRSLLSPLMLPVVYSIQCHAINQLLMIIGSLAPSLPPLVTVPKSLPNLMHE